MLKELDACLREMEEKLDCACKIFLLDGLLTITAEREIGRKIYCHKRSISLHELYHLDDETVIIERFIRDAKNSLQIAESRIE
jgi:hypothetical protein